MVLTGSGVVDSLRARWSESYLEQHFDNGAQQRCGSLESFIKTADGKPLFYYTLRNEPEYFNVAHVSCATQACAAAWPCHAPCGRACCSGVLVVCPVVDAVS